MLTLASAGVSKNHTDSDTAGRSRAALMTLSFDEISSGQIRPQRSALNQVEAANA
jgi:hypothetical protein